jgi:hypothetical protein
MASGVATGGHFFGRCPDGTAIVSRGQIKHRSRPIRSLKRTPSGAGCGIQVQRICPTRCFPVTTSSAEKQLPELNIDLRHSRLKSGK